MTSNPLEGVLISRDELRELFAAMQIEAKAQEGRLGRTILWEAKRRPGSEILQYRLPNGWIIAVAHRWRDKSGHWSRPDPKALLLDQARLYSH